jgi:hypothetical protein
MQNEINTGRYISRLEIENKKYKKEIERLREEAKLKNLEIMRLKKRLKNAHVLHS